MSWLARSIADSLRIDDDEDDDDEEEVEIDPSPNPTQSQTKDKREGNDEDEEEEEEEEENRAARGVREDLSEFTETLTRQFWGVASFLAPPPPPPPPLPPPPPRMPQSRYHIDRSVADRGRRELPARSGSGYDSDEDGTGSVGISRTRDEAADGFTTRQSDRSSNQVVSEIWKMDPSFQQFQREGPIGDAVGITEEVLAFAMNIAHHPETWLDYPLEEEDDIDDFDMSDVQHEHVLAIQSLAPRLAALRIELCPAHMSEGFFWKVYFVLLHSRLNKSDAELLSTPQIVAARAMWMKELQKETKTESNWLGTDSSYVKGTANTWEESFYHGQSDDAPGTTSPRTPAFVPATYSLTTEFETEKHPVVITEVPMIDKSVIEEEPVMKAEDKGFVAGSSFKVPVQNYEVEEDDDWLKDYSDLEGYSRSDILLGNDEDVSFSDLEDDACNVPLKSKKFTTGFDTSAKTSRG